MTPIRRALVLPLLLIASLACDGDGKKKPAASKGDRPQVRAEVLTIAALIEPGAEKTAYEIYVYGNKVRLGNETDQWRLFDTEKKTVTIVDDIDRTYRTLTSDELTASRRKLVSGSVPRNVPSAKIATGGSQQIGKWYARRYTISMGTYRRVLLLSSDTPVPRSFLPLYVSSESLNATFAPALRSVAETLAKVEGFPVIDRSEMTWDGKMHVIERQLVKIESKMIDAEIVAIPPGYRNLRAPDAGSGAGRPGASSPRSDRSAPAEGSSPSAKSRKNP